MRVAFDTSVVVAGLVAGHPCHTRAFAWLAAAHDRRIEAIASAHALAEAWSVLTRLPLEPRLDGATARVALERLAEHLAFIAPTLASYDGALERCVTRGLTSGAIFDSLHLIEAERAGAQIMLTFNAKDFERLSNPTGPRVVVPPDPPSVEL